MNKFIIEINPFPHIMGKDEIVIVETEKDLETTLNLMNEQLKENNPMFEYDFKAWESVESFINSLSIYDVDK